MENSQGTPPIDYIYAVKLGNRLKIYPRLGTAKAQVTRAVDARRGVAGARFAEDVEFWRVGEGGWELMFSALEGDSYSAIPWQTVLEANERRRISQLVARQERKEAEARHLYEQLRAQFEGK